VRVSLALTWGRLGSANCFAVGLLLSQSRMSAGVKEADPSRMAIIAARRDGKPARMAKVEWHPGEQVRRYFASFSYQAQRWKKSRRVDGGEL
jgi:hypothetical protein